MARHRDVRSRQARSRHPCASCSPDGATGRQVHHRFNSLEPSQSQGSFAAHLQGFIQKRVNGAGNGTRKFGLSGKQGGRFPHLPMSVGKAQKIVSTVISGATNPRAEIAAAHFKILVARGADQTRRSRIMFQIAENADGLPARADVFIAKRLKSRCERSLDTQIAQAPPGAMRTSARSSSTSARRGAAEATSALRRPSSRTAVWRGGAKADLIRMWEGQREAARIAGPAHSRCSAA